MAEPAVPGLVQYPQELFTIHTNKVFVVTSFKINFRKSDQAVIHDRFHPVGWP